MAGRLKKLTKKLKADKEVVLAAVTTSPGAWKYVDKNADIWKDDDFVSQMIQLDGVASCEVLWYASNTIRSDKEMLFNVVRRNRVRADLSMKVKEMVLAAVEQDGMLFGCAQDQLRSDLTIAMCAVRKSRSALKFAKQSINQDPGLLEAAGILDNETRPRLSILSVQFCLLDEFTPYACEFVHRIQHHGYFGKFRPYNPNLRSKATCDDSCMGDLDSCKDQDICMRFKFQMDLENCKHQKDPGFMIQFEEMEGLSQGQEIEARMAKDVKLKVFRTFTNKDVFGRRDDLAPLERAVRRWIQNGRTDMNLEEVWIGDGLVAPADLMEQREQRNRR